MPTLALTTAACIMVCATCGMALAQPVDLRTPPQMPSTHSLVPASPRPAIWPRLPLPPLPENDSPHAFLQAARSAVERGQTGEAQEALERAETQLLGRPVAMSSARETAGRRAVLDIGIARQALAVGDRAGTLHAIDDALAMPSPDARHAPPLAVTPSPVADVTLPPSGPRPVTYALLPGHWQPEGAHYIWVLPENTLRHVDTRRSVEGRYVWRDDKWHWVPEHFEGN
jgi:hypothetical protein